MSPVRIAALFTGCLLTQSAPAQLPTGSPSDAVRLTVSQNADGSRTAYEVDPIKKKATATTTSRDGKPAGRINYELDDLGRYARGEVLDAKGAFQFKTQYKYDQNGRLSEELRLNKQDVLQMKLVYAYDDAGKPAGYSVFDGNGKLLGQTQPVTAAKPR
ncbi:MAG: hypothetical protein ACR2ID_00700 [Chthoniobacterales bacterium]